MLIVPVLPIKVSLKKMKLDDPNFGAKLLEASLNVDKRSLNNTVFFYKKHQINLPKNFQSLNDKEKKAVQNDLTRGWNFQTFLQTDKPMPGMCRMDRAMVIHTSSVGPVESGCQTLEKMVHMLLNARDEDKKSGGYSTSFNMVGTILKAGVGGGIRNFM